jgi:hypothetical protein
MPNEVRRRDFAHDEGLGPAFAEWTAPTIAAFPDEQPALRAAHPAGSDDRPADRGPGQTEHAQRGARDFDLPTTMSKFLCLGMELGDVVRAGQGASARRLRHCQTR